LRKLILLLACGFLAGCGAQKPATLKGSLSYDGKPFPLPSNAGEVFISFFGLDAAGKPDPFKKYTGMVKKDGTFEIESSSGELPAGSYLWSIDAAPGKVKEFDPFSLEKTKAKAELKSGANQLTLELKSP
jgi:hypothetical protein